MLLASTRIHLDSQALSELVSVFGGRLTGAQAASARLDGLSTIARPRGGALVPCSRVGFAGYAEPAVAQGAVLLVAEALSAHPRLVGLPAWVHPHPTAVIFELLARARVEDLSGPHGEGTVLAPTAVVLPGVRLGARVRVGHGAVLGAPGFGFMPGPGGYTHVPQLGGVVIEDDVWIGTNTTIDAGTLGPTVVRRGAKLDSHVHVGHNCDVGADALLCAQVGLAGSVVVGAGCVLGGQVGVADHVHIGAGARVAAKSGVIGDVPEGAVVGGYPAVRRAKWLRGLAALYRRAKQRSPH